MAKGYTIAEQTSYALHPQWGPEAFEKPKPKTTRSSYSSTSSTASDRRATVAGENTVIPFVYGTDRIGGKIVAATLKSNKWYVLYAWCTGEVEEISSIRSGGKLAYSLAGDPLEISGVTWTHYAGTTTQTADPTLASAITDFDDDMVAIVEGIPVGICYSVAVYAASQDFLQMDAEIKGAKLYDPRDASTAHSSNPALALADFITSTTYGLGRDIDWDSVKVAANYCDEDLGGGEIRRTLNYAFTKATKVKNVLETLRGYAGCFVTMRNGIYYLTPDKVNTIGGEIQEDYSIFASDIVADTLTLATKDLRNVPTVVRVSYTDTSTTEWTDKEAVVKVPGVDAGTVARRESVIKMPGLNRYSQAYREAIERINYGQLVDLEAGFDSFDEQLKSEAGDVIRLTHPIGITSKPMRVLSVVNISPGRWRLSVEELDQGVYSDEVQTEPSYSDTELPDPFDPPAVENLAAAEELYQKENGTYSSRAHITWDAGNSYPYASSYQVEVYDNSDSTLVVTANVTATEFTTASLAESHTYTIQVRTISTAGTASAWTNLSNFTLQGKTLVPGDVPSLAGLEVGGEVHLSWEPATDIDIWRYEVRYGSVGVTWANSTLIDRVDALRLTTKTIAEGNYDFLVKAIDSVQQYSTTEARKTLYVSLDNDSFLVDTHNFSAPTLTNVHDYLLTRIDDKTRYLSTNNDSIASMFPNAMSTYTNPVADYHTSVSTILLTETWDIGAQVAGDWRIVYDVTALSGSYVIQMELSTDNIAWTSYTSGTAKTTARYARVRITTSGTDTAYTVSPLTVRVNAVPNEESGSSTSLSSGGKQITLTSNYTLAHTIIVTPIGTSSLSAVVDNILVTGSTDTFDVYIFNSSGTQVANDFLWTFKGV